MPDPLDQIFEEPEIAGEVQHQCPRKKRRAGELLYILSGIVVVGLPFTITINNPHHRLSPLLSTKTPGLVIVAAPSSTPMPGLPPTWTPTDSPTDTPTLAPSFTNTPISIIENSLTPTAGLEILILLPPRRAQPHQRRIWPIPIRGAIRMGMQTKISLGTVFP